MPDETNEFILTFANVALTIGGWMSVPYPAGSYPIDPDDRRLSLAAVLAEALEKCGLLDRGKEIYARIDEICEPHFRKDVARLEQVRQQIMKDHPEL